MTPPPTDQQPQTAPETQVSGAVPVARTREEFAAVAYRYTWQHDKLVLPCGPAQGCTYARCDGWRSEYEGLVDGTEYSAAEIAEAVQFRERFLADRTAAGVHS